MVARSARITIAPPKTESKCFKRTAGRQSRPAAQSFPVPSTLHPQPSAAWELPFRQPVTNRNANEQAPVRRDAGQARRGAPCGRARSPLGDDSVGALLPDVGGARSVLLRLRLPHDRRRVGTGL